MRVYIGFDDTDTIDSDQGTGKLARRFEKLLPEGCRQWGVVRQQLLIDKAIPYTTHNSSACVIIDFFDPSLQDQLLSLAIDHIERESPKGSDPGLCFVCDEEAALDSLIAFGRACTSRIVTQKEALQAAQGVHLSGHGGTNDGIIGAAAGVGLTASGWGGRFIEYRRLRQFPDIVSVADLERAGIHVVSMDRDARVPGTEETIETKDWLRPRLIGFKPVLPVLPKGKNGWEVLGEKKKDRYLGKHGESQ